MPIKDIISQLQQEAHGLESENQELKRRLAVIQEALGAQPQANSPRGKVEPEERVVAPVKRNGRSKLSAARVEQLIEMYKNSPDKPVKTIAKEFKVSPFTVYNELKRAGVEGRR
jgi:hypothetical protein